MERELAMPLRRNGGTLLHRVLASSAADARDEVVERALALLRLAPEQRVLELGCGTGDILARLAARLVYGRAVGIAVSPLMARHAARRNQRFLDDGRMEIRIAAGAELPGVDDASFDRVLGVHVVYLWGQPERYVAEIRRVLRPGGRLVLGFRSGGSRSRAPQESPAQVAEWLRSGGFERVEITRGGPAERPLAWLDAVRA